MFSAPRGRHLGWQVVLLMLQYACLDTDLTGVQGRCGPRDLTPECCLKQFPNQWERCTGSSGMTEVAARSASFGAKAAATGIAVAVALKPVIHSAESRGADLAADLHHKVEEALVQCARQADEQANGFHFKGRSPTQKQCEQLRVEQQTWAAYLGHFKHNEAWPCLRKALGALVPGRYLLHPRFQLSVHTGRWEYLDENTISQLVSQYGWKVMEGSIEPDIIIMDERGIIIHVYDLKFPCPDSNFPRWYYYKSGPWLGSSQGELYFEALQVVPRFVSPRWGLKQK